MADIVNLRSVRKKKKRAEAEQRADENRAFFGLTKAQKNAARLENERAGKAHDDHRKDD